jgi:arylsulfatase A-like enzyme
MKIKMPTTQSAFHSVIGRPLVLFITLTVGFSLSSCTVPAENQNVVLIIVDDLGWKDLSVTGSELYETPNIDALALEGVRFDQFYADSPVCSPTRAALMTGKHPAELDITNWIGGSQNGILQQADYEYQLPLNEVTLGDRFGEAGYQTAFIGKWHLGGNGFTPDQQGFDINIGGHGAGQPASYFWPYRRDGGSAWDVPHLDNGVPGEYLTDRLTDEAIAFIRQTVEQPFLLVLSHYSVHTPIQAKEEMTAAIQRRLDTDPTCPSDPSTPLFDNDPAWSTTRTCQDNATYAAMVQSTDESIGRIRAELESSGLSENTVLLFVSDNGGLSSLAGDRASGPTSNRPLRAGKGYLYEGGIRIPMIVYAPKLSASGLRSRPSSTMDVAPTLYDLAGIPVAYTDQDRSRDGLRGQSLLGEIQDAGSLLPRPHYFHFPHYHGSGNRPSGSVRAG